MLYTSRRIHRTQNSSEKFVAKENEQLLKKREGTRSESLVQTPRSDDRASGNRLRQCHQRFEALEKDIQFTRVCEDATFWRRVSTGMSYKTVSDVDDGFGDRTPACREYTLLREDNNSRICATIPGQPITGPVLQVLIIQ